MDNNNSDNPEKNRITSDNPHFSSRAGPGKNTNTPESAGNKIKDDANSSPVGEEFKQKHYPGKPDENGFLKNKKE